MKRKTIFILLVFVVVISSFSVNVSAENAKYRDAFPLPKLTGDLRADFIAVAKSQLGYTEASDGSTVFGAWNGDPYQDWCSEFAAWCAEKAGIPTLVYPKLTGSFLLRDYFAPRKRCFYLDKGVKRSKYDFMEDYEGTKTISVSDILPGDLIICGTGYPSTVPNHTGIFLSYKNGKVETISGNCGDTVRVHEKPLDDIYAVIKPDFELKETELTKDINEVTVWGGKYADYTGKKVTPKITLYDYELHCYLEEEKDYTVKVKNAVKIGSDAEATYTGKGIYTGKLVIPFRIYLKTPELSYKTGKTKIRLLWAKIPGAEKYVVYRSTDGGKTFQEVVTLGNERDYSILKYDKSKKNAYYIRVYVASQNSVYSYPITSTSNTVYASG